MNSNSNEMTLNDPENRTLFAEKLSHYTRRNPKIFHQIDGFHITHGGDDMFVPDKDSDCLFATKTIELMEGATVRVLIPEDVEIKDAIRILKKLAKWVKRSPDILQKKGLRPALNTHDIFQNMGLRPTLNVFDEL